MTVNLSEQLLGLYDPFRDPYGEVAWRELAYASEDVKDHWIEHHFHWRRSVEKANAILKEWGVAATVDLQFVGASVVAGENDQATEIDFVFSITLPRQRSYLLDERWSDSSFGRVMFVVSEPYRLARLARDFAEELTPEERKGCYPNMRRG